MVDGQRQDDARLVSDACDDVGTRDVGRVRSCRSGPLMSNAPQVEASNLTYSDRSHQDQPITHSQSDQERR